MADFTIVSGSAKFVSPDESLIDCLIIFPIIGQVPFTASASDPDQRGLEIWELLQAGTIVPFSTPTLTKPQRKEALKTLIRAHGMSIRRGGFAVNFGTDEQPNLQVLQLRDATPENDDEKNWMASLSAYTAAVIGGAGDLAGAKFRPESNDTVTVTYAQGMGILTSLFDWVASLVQSVWAKCDQIDGASTHAELDVLEADIEQGWPE